MPTVGMFLPPWGGTVTLPDSKPPVLLVILSTLNTRSCSTLIYSAQRKYYSDEIHREALTAAETDARETTRLCAVASGFPPADFLTRITSPDPCLIIFAT